uniref:HTH CENPB-type domain-containing protein n=1 Tax=Steinernema glaseri TaxID=37863 RepID=A0A1I7Z6M5_9BILA
MDLSATSTLHLAPQPPPALIPTPPLYAPSYENLVLHRPTPVKPLYIDVGYDDKPLDLSLPHQLRHQTVIQSPDTVGQTPVSPPSSTEQPCLPTCNLNSNWIAMKFGAASGANRMSYPREFKLMVIDYYNANGKNKYRTCKEFQITKSMLNGWLQKIEKIRESRPGSLKSGRSGRRPQFPDIEKQLYEKYVETVSSGKKVGNRWIRETAKNLAKQQCSEAELAGMCQFSERWLSNFKKRYHINLNHDWFSGGSGSTGSSSSASGADETDSGEFLSEPEHDDDDQEEHEGVINVKEILNKPGQLPIQAFYERCPWLHKRSTLQNVAAEPGKRGRKVQFPEVEKMLFEKVQERQLKGEKISNRWMQEQARLLATELEAKSPRCQFSEHWLHNFKKRYGIVLKTASSVSSPSPTSSGSSGPLDQCQWFLQQMASPTYVD